MVGKKVITITFRKYNRKSQHLRKFKEQRFGKIEKSSLHKNISLVKKNFLHNFICMFFHAIEYREFLWKKLNDARWVLS